MQCYLLHFRLLLADHDNESQYRRLTLGARTAPVNGVHADLNHQSDDLRTHFEYFRSDVFRLCRGHGRISFNDCVVPHRGGTAPGVQLVNVPSDLDDSNSCLCDRLPVYRCPVWYLNSLRQKYCDNT